MRAILTFAMLIGLFVAPSPAQAAYLEYQCRNSSRALGIDRRDFVLCEGGQGGPLFRFTFPAASISGAAAAVSYAVRISAPSAHCSPIKYILRRVSPAGRDVVVGETKSGWYGFLQPGQSEDVDIGRSWGPGEHTILIAALGIVDGCNTGQMQSFGVNAELVPVYQAPRPF